MRNEKEDKPSIENYCKLDELTKNLWELKLRGHNNCLTDTAEMVEKEKEIKRIKNILSKAVSKIIKQSKKCQEIKDRYNESESNEMILIYIGKMLITYGETIKANYLLRFSKSEIFKELKNLEPKKEINNESLIRLIDKIETLKIAINLTERNLDDCAKTRWIITAAMSKIIIISKDCWEIRRNFTRIESLKIQHLYIGNLLIVYGKMLPELEKYQ